MRIGFSGAVGKHFLLDTFNWHTARHLPVATLSMLQPMVQYACQSDALRTCGHTFYNNDNKNNGNNGSDVAHQGGFRL